MAQVFAECLLDAVLDCLKVLPILFLAYLLVAYLSHDHSHKFSTFLAKNRPVAVLYAAFLGCVPQCGFSSVVADLYSRKKVPLGALVAVFVATSDEAIPIMISQPVFVPEMLKLVGIKVLLAIIWGFLVEGMALFAAKCARKNKFSVQKEGASHGHGQAHENSRMAEREGFEHAHGQENFKHEHCECQENCAHKEQCEQKECEQRDFCEHHCEHHALECGHIHTDECEANCGHSHGGNCADNVFLDAFLHTFNIVMYIFVATFVLNFVIEWCGTDALAALLTTNPYSQVVIAGLIGLIPNCASSVLLVELFMSGVLGFPALLAGLTAGAGVGLIILFTKNKKRTLANLGILLMQYAIGVASGLLMTLFFK